MLHQFSVFNRSEGIIDLILFIKIFKVSDGPCTSIDPPFEFSEEDLFARRDQVTHCHVHHWLVVWIEEFIVDWHMFVFEYQIREFDLFFFIEVIALFILPETGEQLLWIGFLAHILYFIFMKSMLLIEMLSNDEAF